MPRDKFGWDLPPGVSLNDIPGNRPDDREVEITIVLPLWKVKNIADGYLDMGEPLDIDDQEELKAACSAYLEKKGNK